VAYRYNYMILVSDMLLLIEGKIRSLSKMVI